MKQRWQLILIGMIFVSTNLCAQNNNRRALIIGISQYSSADVPILTGVPVDMNSAKMIAKGMDIPEENIQYLRDSQATKENILTTIKNFSKQTNDGSRAFIYYSGHGTRWLDIAKNDCVEGMLTYDLATITEKEMAQATQPLSQNMDKTIIMLDSCFSGGVLSEQGLKTRGVVKSSLKPKFFSKATTTKSQEYCEQPVNLKTRGIFHESTKLGALKENLILITAAQPNEISFDEPGKGGLATQAIRDCLLGKARDLDDSGAISMEEVRVCAQFNVDSKLSYSNTFSPSHITVKGNRNLVPILATSTLNDSKPPSESISVTKPLDVPTTSAVVTQIGNQPDPFRVPTEQVYLGTQDDNEVLVSDIPEGTKGALSTLKDVEQQRNPLRQLKVDVVKSTLKIDQDFLNLKITSNHDGYLYFVLLGSDQKSFYILYPNELDKKNFVKANSTITLPAPSWQIRAAGPEGKDHLLVMVSDSPRDLKKVSGIQTIPNSPYVYALGNLSGKNAIFNYLIGKDAKHASERFGAKVIEIEEVK